MKDQNQYINGWAVPFYIKLYYKKEQERQHKTYHPQFSQNSINKTPFFKYN